MNKQTSVDGGINGEIDEKIPFMEKVDILSVFSMFILS